MESIIDVTAWLIPLVLAITLHEAAHGWMAEKFGDNTARIFGRVTFNPFRHIDRFGTLVMPGLLMLVGSPILFGYAKPVPVNFRALAPRRIGMAMVALAGPGTNLLMALAAALCLHLEAAGVTPENASFLYLVLYRMIMVNCVIAMFNMLPIPPLDGSRVVSALLPLRLAGAYERLERFGIGLVLLLVLVPSLLGFPITRYLIAQPASFLATWVLVLTGNGHAASLI